jgi:hypothetical protein
MEVLTGRGYSRHGTRAQAEGFLAQNRKSAWKCVPCLKAGTELLTGREVKAGREVKVGKEQPINLAWKYLQAEKILGME